MSNDRDCSIVGIGSGEDIPLGDASVDAVVFVARRAGGQRRVEGIAEVDGRAALPAYSERKRIGIAAQRQSARTCLRIVPGEQPFDLCRPCSPRRAFVFLTLRISFPAIPLFSHPYKTPRGWGCISVRLFTSRGSRGTSHAFSFGCRLLFSLGSLFRIRFLCFQGWQPLFPKTGGTSQSPLMDAPLKAQAVVELSPRTARRRLA